MEGNGSEGRDFLQIEEYSNICNFSSLQIDSSNLHLWMNSATDLHATPGQRIPAIRPT